MVIQTWMVGVVYLLFLTEFDRLYTKPHYWLTLYIQRHSLKGQFEWLKSEIGIEINWGAAGYGTFYSKIIYIQ